MTRAVALALLMIIALPIALAHVGYVVPASDIPTNSGSDFSWLLQPLSDPLYLALIIATAVITFVVYHFISHNKRFREWAISLEAWMGTYQEFIPWIARLGLGIALIGAGSAGALLSPAVSNTGFHTLQIALGFLLLLGLFTGVVAWLALALYVFGAFMHPYLLGNLDIAAMCLAILMIGSSRPGVDDLFGITFFAPLSRWRRYAPLVLRIGIGVAFMYLALYEKILNPHLSELVVQRYGLMGFIPVSAPMWVLSAGAIEFLVGAMLFFGLRTRLFSAIAFTVLTASFFFFSEAVYSHITLFATLSMLFVTGGGPWSVDEWLAKRERGVVQRRKKR